MRSDLLLRLKRFFNVDFVFDETLKLIINKEFNNEY